MVWADYLRVVENLWADALSRGNKAQGWSLGDLSPCRLFKWLWMFFANKQASLYPNTSDLSNKKVYSGEALKQKEQEGLRYTFPLPNIIQLISDILVSLRGPGHDHAILVRQEMVPRNNVANNRTTKMLLVLRVASVECINKGRSPKSHDGYPVDFLEAHITIFVHGGIQ